jgi:CubicO group peptidase (beta-lactamase class C family)
MIERNCPKIDRTIQATAMLVVITLALVGCSAPEHSRAETYLADWRADNRVPGVAVAVIDGGEVRMWVAGTDGGGSPVSAETPFLVGSVAKTFTSTVVLRLIADGRLEFDHSVAQHAGWLPYPEVTVRELLTHTSGYSAADGLRVADQQRFRSVRDAAESLRMSGRPGEYEYSSANYLVLGAVVEAVTGQPFGSYLQHALFDDLDMTTTAATAERARNLPAGHRSWWGKPVRYRQPLDESGAPYGSVASTLDDLVRYAKAHLDGRVLPARTRDQAWRIQQTTGTRRGYGLGWRIDEMTGRRIVHHTGATPGYFAHLLLIPEEDRAVVVLANAYSERRAESLGSAAFDLATIQRGGRARVRAADPFLTVLTGGLVGLALLGGAATWLGRRWPQRRSGRTVVAGIAAAVVVGLVGLLLVHPMPVPALAIWVPDLLTGVIACAASWAAAAGSVLLPLRRRPHHPRPEQR